MGQRLAAAATVKIVAATIALAVIGVAAPARADDAQEHIQKGTRFYNIEDWPNALKEYKEAYAIDPKPELLWSIAQVQRLSGDCRSAIFTYKAYMRGASSAGANAAQEFITKCEATIAEQQKAVEALQTPPKTTTTAPPTVTLRVQQTPPPPPPSEPRPWALDPLGDVLFIVGVGGLAVGGTFLAVGDSDMSATAQKPTYQQYDHAVDVARGEQEVASRRSSAARSSPGSRFGGSPSSQNTTENA